MPRQDTASLKMHDDSFVKRLLSINVQHITVDSNC